MGGELGKYAQMRDIYVERKTKYDERSMNNRKVVANMQPPLERARSYNLLEISEQGVDVSVLESLDLDRLVLDVEYFKDVRKQLRSCCDSVFELLEGYLK